MLMLDVANNRHITFNNVYKLRKFINTCLSNKFTNFSYPCITLSFIDSAFLSPYSTLNETYIF